MPGEEILRSVLRPRRWGRGRLSGLQNGYMWLQIKYLQSKAGGYSPCVCFVYAGTQGGTENGGHEA